MSASLPFEPQQPLLSGRAHSLCRAIVILPVRNEESSIASTLDALGAQVDSHLQPLPSGSFEILLLLNNCTDQSAAVVRQWQFTHTATCLHVVTRDLPAHLAHAGTARRLLMDTAWSRLSYASAHPKAILSTDSDTTPAPSWISENLRALAQGADAVGGVIRLKPGHLHLLPSGVRHAYLRDRRYQQLVAELESLLDPQACDPWPRHLDHFGASLACTPVAYARAGGMPPASSLEDVAFVDALRRVGARVRHEPSVVVYTSSRLEGRAPVGLSGQLRCWREMSDAGREHRVPSLAWLTHRFGTLRQLRRIYAGSPIGHIPVGWRERISEGRSQAATEAAFLLAIDADKLIDQTFRGQRDVAIEQANLDLVTRIHQLRAEYFEFPVVSYTPSAATLN